MSGQEDVVIVFRPEELVGLLKAGGVERESVSRPSAVSQVTLRGIRRQRRR